MANMELNGKRYEFPEVVGSEGERAVDISELRSKTGYITLDDGYGNTGSCQSKVTFIDGEKGILRYRGIPIEELAEKSNVCGSGIPVDMGQTSHASGVEQLLEFADKK